jgi:hypothetical protein
VADDRFDVVLRLDREEFTAGWQIQQLFPNLLAGDRDDPFIVVMYRCSVSAAQAALSF